MDQSGAMQPAMEMKTRVVELQFKLEFLESDLRWANVDEIYNYHHQRVKVQSSVMSSFCWVRSGRGPFVGNYRSRASCCM